ncbi:MAG: MotA/TolQ/ExbB proton channel family protein [Putridiphycobacter sp.]|nr:MotA/TolQ/ExbB proton channel family protein [Putridiphycobacter sp.]
MKKGLAFLAILGLLTFGATTVYAQDEPTAEAVEAVEDSAANVADETVAAVEEKVAEPAVAVPEASFVNVLKQRFIEGGPAFMGIVLACLIFGLAMVIERIVYLNLATTNTKKLVADVDQALASGGVEAAKEVCRNTRGPVASIFYQGLDRADEGIDMVEKSVISYGGVQMGLLEKGMSWIQLFIALAPMLGFMGTVIGMIQAFDTIETNGGVQADQIAGDIKVALLTTVFGLIVAIILQIFYNYLISKVDSIVNDMEDASISLIDVLLKNNATAK